MWKKVLNAFYYTTSYAFPRKLQVQSLVKQFKVLSQFFVMSCMVFLATGFILLCAFTGISGIVRYVSQERLIKMQKF